MATGYRVTTETGTVEFTEHDKAIAYHAEHGIGDIEPFEIQAPDWNKEAYCEEASAAHSEWYRRIYTCKPDFDYESKGEIAMYLEHPDAELRAQATYLTNLWFNSVEKLYKHYEEVTEETANVDAFIQSLPTFETAP